MMTVQGGYTSKGVLTLHAPQPASTADVGACPINASTDAEVVGSLTITNTTPNYSSEPGMSLWFGTGVPGFAVVDSNGCEDDNTDGAIFYATSPIGPEQSISEPIWLVIPDFYSPDHPDGDTTSLANDPSLSVGPYVQTSGTYTAGISAIGPGGASVTTSGSNALVNLAQLPSGATPTAATGATSTGAAFSNASLSVEPKITGSTAPAPKSLVTKDIIVGSGTAAADGDTLTVNYVGGLYRTGQVFDASWEKDQPFQFQLGVGDVIEGWDRGLVGMRVGGRRELILPGALAYPDGAAGVPAGAPVVFIVDLLAVTRGG